MLIASLFAAFGAFCGLWLSVVGLVATTVGILAVCVLVNHVLGGPLTLPQLIGCAISLQVGYFMTVALKAGALKRFRSQGQDMRTPASGTSAELHSERNVKAD